MMRNLLKRHTFLERDLFSFPLGLRWTFLFLYGSTLMEDVLELLVLEKREAAMGAASKNGYRLSSLLDSWKMHFYAREIIPLTESLNEYT